MQWGFGLFSKNFPQLCFGILALKTNVHRFPFGVLAAGENKLIMAAAADGNNNFEGNYRNRISIKLNDNVA